MEKGIKKFIKRHSMKWYYFIVNTAEGIINIIKWFPIIWNDRNYDFGFIYRILHFKLKNMEKFFNSDKTWTANAKDTACQLMVARVLCERLLAGEYTSNALIPVENKYGNLEWHFNKLEDGNYELIFDETEEEREARIKAYKHSDYMEKQDIEYLCNYIKKHIRTWAD